MAIKVTFIGAGSLTFTRGLFRDILTVPALQDTRFSFTDINPKYLEMAAGLCRRDIDAHQLPATLTATVNRRKALEGADYVVSCVRIGGLPAFRTDIDIPLKYGVDQCVGDTLCIGGIMYGQRNISAIMDFCRDIREVARPGCLFLNYANPNAMNTWAANHFGKVNTVGLCHGVMGGHWQIVEVIKLLVNGDKTPVDPGYREITARDVDIICAGINHQTWYIRVRFDGQDWTERLLQGFERHPVYSKTEKVRIDMIRRFGYYSTESNGHLSEYLPWYRKRPNEIRKWIDLSSWINGETGGYLRVCREMRNWFEKSYRQSLLETVKPLTPEHRGHEHGSYIIEGLETGRPYRGHFNVVNNGCISNLPDDAIVEVPGYVDRNGINVPRVGPLPLGCAAVCNASVSVQRLAVHAAITGDVALLKQAAMMDPLTGAVCDPEDISQMTDEMLVAQAAWLPQYRHAIPRAKARLEAARRRRDYRGTRRSSGVARLPASTTPHAADYWARKEKTRPATVFQATDLLPPADDLRRMTYDADCDWKRELKAHVEGGAAGFVDIRSIHDSRDGIVLLKTQFRAARSGSGKLLLGPDGPFKAWVNGRAAMCHPETTNPAVPGHYRARVRWRKGNNVILVALSSHFGRAWGLFAAAG